jgi:uncharacterized protein YceH (UPF0502 family)
MSAIKLTPYEARVLGALIEKEITTPEQYPLSLNALTAACNQKSNRDPVLDLSEAEVRPVVDGLVKRYLASTLTGGRVVKYRQRLCNSAFGDVQLTPLERGILCELLLRGPQTPGELRTRAERLCAIQDVAEVEAALVRLAERDPPWVVRLAREPGRREARYAHLLGDGSEPEWSADPRPEPETREKPSSGSDRERIAALEREVADLRGQVAELRQLLEGLTT